MNFDRSFVGAAAIFEFVAGFHSHMFSLVIQSSLHELVSIEFHCMVAVKEDERAIDVNCVVKGTSYLKSSD